MVYTKFDDDGNEIPQSHRKSTSSSDANTHVERKNRHEDRRERQRDNRSDDRRRRDHHEHSSHRRRERSRDRSAEIRRKRDSSPEQRRRHRPAESTNDGPAWATARVKEHAERLKERKQLFQKTEGDEPTSSSCSVDKNIGMWSNAIAATGVDDKQAEKFKKLLGFKNAATADIGPQKADGTLSEERKKQKTLISSLDRQFNAAREASNSARGTRLGFKV